MPISLPDLLSGDGLTADTVTAMAVAHCGAVICPLVGPTLGVCARKIVNWASLALPRNSRSPLLVPCSMFGSLAKILPNGA